MADTTLTIRVGGKLKKRFTEAARAQDRSASLLLRDYMRRYVDAAAHDAWFRGEVEQGLADLAAGAPTVSHEEVVAAARARLKRKRRR